MLFERIQPFKYSAILVLWSENSMSDQHNIHQCSWQKWQHTKNMPIKTREALILYELETIWVVITKSLEHDCTHFGTCTQGKAQTQLLYLFTELFLYESWRYSSKVHSALSCKRIHGWCWPTTLISVGNISVIICTQKPRETPVKCDCKDINYAPCFQLSISVSYKNNIQNIRNVLVFFP